MSDYLDPVVAEIVGDNSGLLATIAESQGAMSEFAASAPALGQVGAPGESLAPGIVPAVEEAAAAVTPEHFAPVVEAAAAAGTDAGAVLGRNLTEAEVAALSDEDFDRLFTHLQETAAEAGTSAGATLGRNLSEAEVAALSDEDFEAFVAHLQATASQAGQAAEAAAGGGGGEAMAARWAGFASELEATQAAAAQAATELEAAGDAADDAGKKAEDAGNKASTANMHWLALGAGFLAITAGPLALSSAVLGVGYLIADFGGEAKGDLQEVEEAFRSSAEQAALAYQPALQNITQSLTGMVRQVEPAMADMFTELSGPAESFFAGFADSVEQGMNALVPAISALGPVISEVAGDLGPLFVGVAGFIQDMSSAFTANGGNQELAQLATEIGSLLPVVGQLVGEVSTGLLPVMEAATPILQFVADGLNAIGAPGAFAIATVWTLTSAFNLGKSAVDAFTTAGNTAVGLLYGQAGASDAAAAAEQGEAAAAGQAAVETEALAGAAADAGTAEAAATLETEALGTALDGEGTAAAAAAVETAGMGGAAEAAGVAADGAALGIGDLLIALAPWAALAAGAALAGYELGQHWQDVENFFESAGDRFMQYGTDIVNGLVSGISGAWSGATSWISGLGNDISTWFTSTLGISSPSTVFAGYGANIVQGLVQGIAGGSATATSATAALAAAAGAGFATGGGSYGGAYAPAGGSSGSGGGSSSTVINLNLTVEAPLASASASQIADAILPALQDLNLLNGQSMASHTGLKGGRF